MALWNRLLDAPSQREVIVVVPYVAHDERAFWDEVAIVFIISTANMWKCCRKQVGESSSRRVRFYSGLTHWQEIVPSTDFLDDSSNVVKLSHVGSLGEAAWTQNCLKFHLGTVLNPWAICKGNVECVG